MKRGNSKEIDENLNTNLKRQKVIGAFVEKFNETIQSICKKTFKCLNSPNNTAKGKSVPWYAGALKLMRKNKRTKTIPTDAT